MVVIRSTHTPTAPIPLKLTQIFDFIGFEVDNDTVGQKRPARGASVTKEQL